MTRRRYNYEKKEDHETILWMKAQARKEGKPYGQWCHENGILSEWDEKQANREIPESWVGPRTMAAIVGKLSQEEYNGTFPGGDQAGSILLDASRMRVKLPKRPRGRPRKHFEQVRGDD